MQAIVPRALGPATYGDFVFLTSVFTRFTAFVGFSTPLALNNKIAQRPADAGLTTFYAYYAAAVAIATGVFIAAVRLLQFDDWLWPGLQPTFVGAAALWALVVWTNNVVGGVADAYGHTVETERTRMWQAIFSAALIGFLYAAGALNLATVFIYHYVVLGILTITWIAVLRRASHPVLARWRLDTPEVARYLREFYAYSQPLAVYTAFAFVTGVGERWLLQTFGGSTEQGFFGLAFQISAISFLFTGAMTPVLSRELSIAARTGDTAEMGRLFRRHIPLLYAVAAVLCAFVASQADRVVLMLGGGAYAGAAWPMAIMAVYPAHQTYGQLCGSVFYATGRTKLYRNIGIAAMSVGVVLAYFLVAPARAGGIDGGSVGLAAKTVLMQIFAVNLQLYYSCRLLGLRFGRYAGQQIVAFASPLGLAVLARAAGELVAGQNLLVALVASAGVYGLLVTVMAIVVPQVFGVSRRQLTTSLQMVLSAVRK